MRKILIEREEKRDIGKKYSGGVRGEIGERAEFPVGRVGCPRAGQAAIFPQE